MKDTKLTVVVDNTQANAAIDETGKAVEELTAKTRGVASKGTKKDWMGLTDLFSSVLPRSLQRSMRMFKSTGRSVGRLSKSFKFLKGAIASTGIGLLIIGLGELAANWDAIATALSGVTEEEKRQAKAQKEVTEQQTKSEAELRRFIVTAQDDTDTTLNRTAALNKLAKAFPQLEGLEVGSLETNELINQAMADNLEMIKLRSDEIVNQQTVENKIEDAREAAGRLTATEYAAFSSMMEVRSTQQMAFDMRDRIIAERKAAAELLFAQERADAQASQRDTDTAINLIQQGITDQIEEQLKLKKEGEDAERKAEAARKKRAQDKKNNLLFLANLEKELSEQILLSGIEDEQERAEKVLDIRHKELEAKAKLAGASKEQLKQIDAAHLLDLAELRESFEGDDDDTKIEDQAALREELRQAVINEETKDREQAKALFDERMELAHKDEELEMAALILFNSEIDAIEVFYRDKKIADDQALVDKEIADAKKVAQAKISSFKATANAAKGVFNTLEGLAKEGSDSQKALAISGVLLSQAVAVANSIAGATAAGKGTGAAAPFTTPVFILQMVTHTLAAFAGIKRILNQADAATSGIGGSGGGSGAGSPTIPLIPLGRFDSPSKNNQAYVVQSQLEGQNLNADQLKMQTVL